MTTLLTFLGTANYSETTYVLEARRHTTRYCPAAIAHFIRPASTLVVVTKDAKARHFESLADEIAAVTKPVAVPIPDGHSETDLWTIFDALTSQIDHGTELVVDITNGFRSLPFLSFLALAFLRVAKEVQVGAVYYGAWDARDLSANESPIFDLTPFVTLLDWTAATDQFLETGDSHSLARQLRAAHRLPWQRQPTGTATDLPRQLTGAATTLETLGQSLRLARPEEIMTVAATLQAVIPSVRTEAETWAKPFNLLLDRTAADYAPLALIGDPRAKENQKTSLSVMARLVEWYVARRQYVQAIVTAREWVVSYVTQIMGWDMIAHRQAAEELLNGSARLRKLNVKFHLDAGNQPAIDAAVSLWAKLPDLRNDIAHVGMRVHPRSVSSIIKAAGELPNELAALAKLQEADAKK